MALSAGSPSTVMEQAWQQQRAVRRSAMTPSIRYRVARHRDQTYLEMVDAIVAVDQHPQFQLRSIDLDPHAAVFLIFVFRRLAALDLTDVLAAKRSEEVAAFLCVACKRFRTVGHKHVLGIDGSPRDFTEKPCTLGRGELIVCRNRLSWFSIDGGASHFVARRFLGSFLARGQILRPDDEMIVGLGGDSVRPRQRVRASLFSGDTKGDD